MCFKTFGQIDFTLSYQCGSQENKEKNDRKTTTVQILISFQSESF